MFKERKFQQDNLVLMSMEEMVPKDHLLRKISRSMDFGFINESTKHLYSQETGRNCVEPVVLFKIVLLQTLYGIKSMRATIKQCETDAAFRWFLGIPFGEPVPHYSTFSQNYIRRYQKTEIFEEIFAEVLNQAISKRLVSGRDLFSDSTHIKANANNRKYTSEIRTVVKQRKLELEAEINQAREELGREGLEFEESVETKEIKVSTTDPESGYYHRDEKEKGFMYLDHRTVDGLNNFIVDVHITPGNVHDSKPYLSRLDYILSKYAFKTQQVGLDSGYYSWEIMEALEGRGIYSVIAYRRFNSNKEDRKNFIYHPEDDTYICPIGCVLPKKNVDKMGYRQYYDAKQCEGCPMLQSCAGKKRYKTIRRHLKQEVYEKARERRLSDQGKALYARRKETVERSFADSKQNHGYRYATHRGLKKNQDYAWLSCSAQNLKKMALILFRDPTKTLSMPLTHLKNFLNRLIRRFSYPQKKIPVFYNGYSSTV